LVYLTFLMATKLKARAGRISIQIRNSGLPIADPNTKEIFTNTLKDGKSGRRAWQRKYGITYVIQNYNIHIISYSVRTLELVDNTAPIE
jgi:hypothetical protein